MSKKKGGRKMSPSTLSNTKKRTFLSDSRKIIQKAIKEKGLTREDIEKSFNNSK
ncbi:hypothetical protein [Paenibacillus sp. NPDC055715]